MKHFVTIYYKFPDIVITDWHMYYSRVLCHTLLIQIKTCYESIYSLHILATPADYTWLPIDVTLPDKFPIDVDKIVQQRQVLQLFYCMIMILGMIICKAMEQVLTAVCEARNL